MKIIVTGATGFIGRNFCAGLRDDGMEVIATGRSAEAGTGLCSEGKQP